MTASPFRTTASQHPVTTCSPCSKAAESAEIMARVTGSVGGTHTESGPGGTVFHSATVTRLAPPSHRELRRIADEATAARVAKGEECADQEAEVSRLNQLLMNAQAVLRELAADEGTLAEAEAHAWSAVTNLEIADHEAYLAANAD
jgi:hypothetical protein